MDVKLVVFLKSALMHVEVEAKAPNQTLGSILNNYLINQLVNQHEIHLEQLGDFK